MNKVRKKAFVDKDYCVACGVCAKNCPLGAIEVYKGIYAKVNFDKCVGCSKCAKMCPASIIEIKGEDTINEK
ncbi:MAG: 4Fe-4S binding protein [Clostridium sp.]|nr:4Fe-4S binding protein [Clostridium sp.]